MSQDIIYFSCLISVLIWLIIWLLPWRSWSTRESLDSDRLAAKPDLSDVTVLIPARNEALHICSTLDAVFKQGDGLKVVVIDDQSTDQTATVLKRYQTQQANTALTIITGQPLPEGWSGKLWALQQGLEFAKSPLILLLDADIRLLPGLLTALKHKKTSENLHLISLMARLPMQNFWEKLLLPAFVYFFKMLYPFALNNSQHPRWRNVAAAAGGCILVDAQVLAKIDAFESLRDALIDDCKLAQKVKQQHFRVWLGLSHSLQSCRLNHRLSDIWQMVARTAFTQLFYSWSLLLLITALMLVVYVFPLAGLFHTNLLIQLAASLSLGIMLGCYIPTLRYYSLSPAWALLMPVITILFLVMSWSSAFGYAMGRRSSWKQRVYRKTLKVPK